MASIVSESSATSSVRYAARGIVKTPLGVATLIPVNTFLERILPPLSKHGILEDTMKKLRFTKKGSSRKPITLEGRWRGFKQDPAAMKCQPCSAFKHFPEAVSSIIRAGCKESGQLRKSFTFRNNPIYVEDFLGREERGFPNAYLLLDQDAIWSNVIASGEYRKTNYKEDRQHNVAKVTKSMAECMYRDPRRRFTFGYTIENTNMRMWYCDRLQIIVSESFNFITDYRPMIYFFLSLVNASIGQLGWDPTMIPLEDGQNFDIRVDGLDGVQRVYRTLQLLARPNLLDIKGKGTRVWKAILVQNNEACGEPVIIKDAWVDSDHRPEGYILNDIHSFPVNTTTHTQKNLAGAFPTPLCHGYVYSDQDRSQLDSVLLIDACSDDPVVINAPLNISLWTNSAGAQSSTEEPDASHKRYRVHYRIVYKEVGKPLSQEQSFPVIYKMLAQTAYALHHLHQAGWVHRDISPGNIIIVADRATLIDLEYARREGHGREYRMGTPGFMAVEVNDQKYLLEWAAKKPNLQTVEEKPISDEELYRELWPSEDNPPSPRAPVILPSPPPPPIFRYNALHDLESLWWIAVYFVVKRRIVEKAQKTPSTEDIAGLAAQCKWACRLFDGYKDRCCAIVHRTSETMAAVSEVVHPLVQPIISALEDLRRNLRAAYIDKEADPETPGFHPKIHRVFISKLLNIACASLQHISLLPLPELDIYGKVIIPPDVGAISAPERMDKDGDGEVVEEPKHMAQDRPCTDQEAPDALIPHKRRGRKRSLDDHDRDDHTGLGVKPPKRTRARTNRTDRRPPRATQRTRPYLHRKAKLPLGYST